MIGDPKTLKQPALVAFIAMGILLVGAVVFYEERMFFSDASYIAYTIINDDKFYIQESRYGSFITQMVPYFGQKLHLPLKSILLGYSISFNLFYFAVNALLIFGYRQYRLAILMVFYYFLFVTESFFWTNNEIHQAVAWMFLFFGTIFYLKEQEKHPAIQYTAFLLLAFITIFTHFVVIIPLVFLWVYFLMEKGVVTYSTKVRVWLSVVLIAIISAKFFIGINADYDRKLLQGITKFAINNVYKTFSSTVVTLFLYRCVTLYWVGTVVLAVGVAKLLLERKIKQLVWLVLSVVGYCIIINLIYGGYNEDILLFYAESEWASMALLVATPFVFIVLPRLRPFHGVVLLSVILLIRIGYISAAAPTFQWRTEFKDRVISQMKKKGITKLALYEDKEISKKLMLDWAIAEETLLQSAADGDNPQMSFRFVGRDDTVLIKKLQNDADGFSFSYLWNTQKKLNKWYFKDDSTRTYSVMTYEQLFK